MRIIGNKPNDTLASIFANSRYAINVTRPGYQALHFNWSANGLWCRINAVLSLVVLFNATTADFALSLRARGEEGFVGIIPKEESKGFASSQITDVRIWPTSNRKNKYTLHLYAFEDGECNHSFFLYHGKDEVPGAVPLSNKTAPFTACLIHDPLDKVYAFKVDMTGQGILTQRDDTSDTWRNVGNKFYPKVHTVVKLQRQENTTDGVFRLNGKKQKKSASFFPLPFYKGDGKLVPYATPTRLPTRTLAPEPLPTPEPEGIEAQIVGTISVVLIAGVLALGIWTCTHLEVVRDKQPLGFLNHRKLQ
jgi:hypothetical protein